MSETAIRTWYAPAEEGRRTLPKWMEQFHVLDQSRWDPYGFVWSVCGKSSPGMALDVGDAEIRKGYSPDAVGTLDELRRELCPRCVKLTGGNPLED